MRIKSNYRCSQRNKSCGARAALSPSLSLSPPLFSMSLAAFLSFLRQFHVRIRRRIKGPFRVLLKCAPIVLKSAVLWWSLWQNFDHRGGLCGKTLTIRRSLSTSRGIIRVLKLPYCRNVLAFGLGSIRHEISETLEHQIQRFPSSLNVVPVFVCVHSEYQSPAF